MLGRSRQLRAKRPATRAQVSERLRRFSQPPLYAGDWFRLLSIPDGESIAAAVEDLRADQAIRRVILRIARGTDRGDLELVRSCYHPDAFDDHGGTRVQGRHAGPAAEFVESLKVSVARYESSTHYVSNILIEREGDLAWSETYCRAVLRIPATEATPALDRTVLCRYFDRFECRDGAWRISHRRVIYTGGRDDVVERDVPPETLGQAGRRDRTDPTYDRDWITRPWLGE